MRRVCVMIPTLHPKLAEGAAKVLKERYPPEELALLHTSRSFDQAKIISQKLQGKAELKLIESISQWANEALKYEEIIVLGEVPKEELVKLIEAGHTNIKVLIWRPCRVEEKGGRREKIKMKEVEI